MDDASTFGRNSTSATPALISLNNAFHNVTITWNACTTQRRSEQINKRERKYQLTNLIIFTQFARVTRIKAEELKQAEKRQKLKEAANAAATSNLPRLNIVDDKQSQPVESKA